MTVQEFQARRIERIAEALAYFVETTRPERLNWRPEARGAAIRSVLEQVSECILVNRYFAEMLRGGAPEPRYRQPEAAISFADAEDAQEQLLCSAGNLADAVRAMADEDLARSYAHRRGPVPGEAIIEMPYRNMAYHAGQVNFIQTLYGDSEFHVPPTWT
jgi:hypothetical protein